MRYEIDFNQIEDLIQRHQPLSETEQRQLEALQRTIAAAMLDEEFRGLADAEDKLGVLLRGAARKLAKAASDEDVLGLPEELEAWAEFGVPEAQRGAFSAVLAFRW